MVSAVDSDSDSITAAMQHVVHHSNVLRTTGLQASDATSGSSIRARESNRADVAGAGAGTGMGVRVCDKYIRVHALARNKKK